MKLMGQSLMRQAIRLPGHESRWGESLAMENSHLKLLQLNRHLLQPFSHLQCELTSLMKGRRAQNSVHELVLIDWFG